MANQLVFITSYPPRECGIATYSKDLIDALKKTCSGSVQPVACALENGPPMRKYEQEVKYILDTSQPSDYLRIANEINSAPQVKAVGIQHEFGLFGGPLGEHVLLLLHNIVKPVMVTFHTVLPKPDDERRAIVRKTATEAKKIIVMTKDAADILKTDYQIPTEKISVIPHGTHPVKCADSDTLRKRYRLPAKGLILATFGLLSRGKSIETALDALPGIVKKFPQALYLIIGQTHPEVRKQEGEVYRNFLIRRIEELDIAAHVRFVNRYVPTDELLEYLTATDIYLFTSKDPNQAVSGTFAYALSCGCPVVSTPIPHAREVLTNDVGRMADFGQSAQFEQAILELLDSPSTLQHMRANALQLMKPTEWNNVAVAYFGVVRKMLGNRATAHTRPSVSYNRIKEPSFALALMPHYSC